MSIRFCKINFLCTLLIFCAKPATAQYAVSYDAADSSTFAIHQRLKTSFPTQRLAIDYISSLPAQMAALGYLSASVDSLKYGKDSAFVRLFAGQPYRFSQVKPDAEAEKLMTRVNISLPKKATPAALQKMNDQLLDYFENTGHPFAMVLLDSSRWQDGDLTAVLRVDPGSTYKIDSIHVRGKGRISSDFLQQYLHIPNGSLYNRELLDQVAQRVGELPFLAQSQPWQLNMRPGGAVIELFLEKKRSNQVYALVGFAPSSQQLEGGKLLLSGEANVKLSNELGAGETIAINWQQLQYKSPRVNLQFQYPYLFKSAFGIDAGFELFKKDSLWVNINARIGLLYELSTRQTGKIVLQSLQTNVSFIDTNLLRKTKLLPAILDVSSVNVGMEYSYNGTNYRLNPRTGWDISLQASVGTKKVKQNSGVTRLKDPANPAFNFGSLYDSVSANAFQLRARSTVSYFVPLGKQTVLKVANQSGWYQSPDIFTNEMFQIGGYRLLRGFDEESIYTNLFSVLTAEFRYLLARNSYFYAFADQGFTSYHQRGTSFSHSYTGSGLGLVFETGNSLLNISLAAGKREDLPLNLRQAKIHLGFVNFF